MKLTRKFLTSLGIEDESKQDQIIAVHTETVDALKDELAGEKEKSEKADAIQKELDAANKKIAEYEKAPTDDWEKKYKDAQKALDDYKADVAKKEKTEKIKAAYRDLLKSAGVSEKRLDAVMKVSDLSGIDLEKDGTLKDVEKLTESVKTEWADFIGTTSETGNETPNPQKKAGEGADNGQSRAAMLAARYHTSMYGKGEK